MKQKKQKDIPNFIKFFWENKDQLVKQRNYDYEIFIRLQHAVAEMRIKGWGYKEVKNLKPLIEIAAYLNEHERLRWAPNMVDYVYTNGKVMNPFGPWRTYEIIDPLAVLHFCQEQQYPRKAAGLVFTALFWPIREILDEEVNAADENDQNLWLYKPEQFYELAGLSPDTCIKYMNEMGWQHGYERYNNGVPGKNNLIRTRHWIKLTENTRQKFEMTKEKYSWRYYGLLKYNPELESDINFECHPLSKSKTLIRLCNNYNQRFINDSTSRFHLPHLKGNPFIRIYKKDQKIHAQTQLKLFYYEFLIASLYAKPESASDELSELLRKFKSRIKLNKIINNIESVLLKNNLYNSIETIDSPATGKTGRHSEQIENCKRIVQTISNRGIGIDLIKAKGLQRDLIERIKKEEKRRRCERNFSIEFGDEPEEIKNNNPEETKGFQEEDDFQIDTDSLESWKEKEKDLRYIISSCNRFYSAGDRAYGLFTTSGASTHRMTCRQINLQGMRREFKKTLLTAREGWKLLSADVSGQDISISANLAFRLFQDKKSFEEKFHAEMDECYRKICLTLQRLRTPGHKAVTHLKDLILKNDLSSLQIIRDEEEIRDVVKTCIYIKLYGGGMDAAMDKALSKALPAIISLLELVYDMIHLQYRPVAIKTLKQAQKELFNIKEHAFISSDAIQERIQELECRITRASMQMDDYRTIFQATMEYFNREYPGITTMFDYLLSYYERFGCTYPTFLGWQTVVDVRLDSMFHHNITRSMNYPIQASGGEFIRQWLIEISKLPGYSNYFHIVNTIHDQVIVEVMSKRKKDYTTVVSEGLLYTARRAAEYLGIDPLTIQVVPEFLNVGGSETENVEIVSNMQILNA